MALVEDASAPAALTGTTGPGATGVTTANFNPPASSLIVVAITSDGTVNATSNASVNDNIGNGFGVQAQISATNQGYASIFTHYLPTAQTGYNVKIILSSAMQGASSSGYIIQTWVILGAATIQNGATFTGTAGQLSGTLTPKKLGSLVYGATNDFQSSTIPTALANTTLSTTNNNTGAGDAWATFRSTNTISALTSQTFGCSNTDPHALALYEVVPGVEPATIAWFTA